MKYLVNTDCYLVDDKGEVTALADPTIEINASSNLDASAIKTEVKNKMTMQLRSYVMIKESLTKNDKAISGSISDRSINYEIYVGKTGKEVIKKKD